MRARGQEWIGPEAALASALCNWRRGPISRIRNEGGAPPQTQPGARVIFSGFCGASSRRTGPTVRLEWGGAQPRPALGGGIFFFVLHEINQHVATLICQMVAARPDRARESIAWRPTSGKPSARPLSVTFRTGRELAQIEDGVTQIGPIKINVVGGHAAKVPQLLIVSC